MNNFNKSFEILISSFFIILLLTSAAAAESDFQNREFLISAAEVHQMIQEGKGNLKIIDVRNSTKYLLGHLPQAVNMWNDDFSDPEGWVQGLIAKPGAFAAAAQEKGINNDSEVILYDDNNGIWAARLWWVFQVYDHQNIKVLEGGYDAWENEGFDSKIFPHRPQKGDFVVSDVINQWIVNSDTIAENLDNQDFIILDTRSEAEFSGAETNSGAPRKGRIPNSIHLKWNEVLTENYKFKSAAEITEIYTAKDITKDKEVIAVLSHTGVRAAHTFFTLKLLGYQNLKLYDESWVGWSSRTDLPVEKK
jgi:thiosulfate/3-mercaptopyruvate sulfurtransferase